MTDREWIARRRASKAAISMQTDDHSIAPEVVEAWEALQPLQREALGGYLEDGRPYGMAALGEDTAALLDELKDNPPTISHEEYEALYDD